jgi:hypothetical protein
VHKDVAQTIVALDKAVAFLLAEPLDAPFHSFWRWPPIHDDDIYSPGALWSVLDPEFHGILQRQSGNVDVTSEVTQKHSDVWVSIVRPDEAATHLMVEFLDVSPFPFIHPSFSFDQDYIRQRRTNNLFVYLLNKWGKMEGFAGGRLPML